MSTNIHLWILLWVCTFLYFLDLVRIFSLVAQIVKNFPALQETQVWSLGREDPLEKEMATQYSCLENSMERGAWQITVHGVTKNWTQLSNTFFFKSNFQWNKSDREILYVITYVWNPKSKTKEYNNSKTLRYREQASVYQCGEGGGEGARDRYRFKRHKLLCTK